MKKSLVVVWCFAAFNLQCSEHTIVNESTDAITGTIELTFETTCCTDECHSCAVPRSVPFNISANSRQVVRLGDSSLGEFAVVRKIILNYGDHLIEVDNKDYQKYEKKTKWTVKRMSIVGLEIPIVEKAK